MWRPRARRWTCPHVPGVYQASVTFATVVDVCLATCLVQFWDLYLQLCSNDRFLASTPAIHSCASFICQFRWKQQWILWYQEVSIIVVEDLILICNCSYAREDLLELVIMLYVLIQ
ncbi:uncharacterized protein LOC133922182 isoform X2 [Phragmites australis]|uniref:uncharacterized protein LOC133922182 isoform X2 n=1 Tax=Phragmites australis TaxID=29695 RepID=UPI002D78309C|nr:uncharacterized protein LOC133922182 isoform X2 [Phragmites australis]